MFPIMRPAIVGSATDVADKLSPKKPATGMAKRSLARTDACPRMSAFPDCYHGFADALR